MKRAESDHSLAAFAKAGFQDLAGSRDQLQKLSENITVSADDVLDASLLAADPDLALFKLTELAQNTPAVIQQCSAGELRMLLLLFGASPALADVYIRHPLRLRNLIERGPALVDRDEALMQFDDAITEARQQGSNLTDALRLRYREMLASVMLYDLTRGAVGNASDNFEHVARSLTDLADAVFQAALPLAEEIITDTQSLSPITAEEIAATRFAIVAMGKCGAGELNVVSDVDVMFVIDPATELNVDRAVNVATKLATEVMRVIHDPSSEPPLWQVDPNLRPEGKQGPLVRTLTSMLTYYQKWAKTWEFQALLKARFIAGDETVGSEFVIATRSLVWTSASRDDFIADVQRMRERVTENIESHAIDHHLKLGPGGLRDIEFSVQLLQLVHGQYDDSLHHASTVQAIQSLVSGGYIARSDGETMSAHYRWLRVLEHRLQLQELRRTAMMPKDETSLRRLARASRFADTAPELLAQWSEVKREVRILHSKIFYAPLLAAIAALPDDEIALDTDRARARLMSIGFTDPDGALRHLSALTQGTSRTAKIQRNLLPVILQWLANGTDPDFGLIAYRRISEANRDTPWFLRLLRDGSDAAERLTSIISRSRFAADLIEVVPDSVSWLEDDALLRPLSMQSLTEEMNALVKRRPHAHQAAEAIKGVYRREVLRLAMGKLVAVLDDFDVSQGLNSVVTALLQSLLAIVKRENTSPEPEQATTAHSLNIALIGMGRFGGREMGFASDIDVMAVYQAGSSSEGAMEQAVHMMSELQRLVVDSRFGIELDFDLRPEGKNGPIARSIDGYRQYYERWSLTWESQALLRARTVAGDDQLGEQFIELADEHRYPANFDDSQLREIRRMKARVEAERLPRGVDPHRHLKLGPGGISDVEWLVQLMQLQHGRHFSELRTQSTLEALAALEYTHLLPSEEVSILRDAWELAASIRSAITLWSDKKDDVLPTKRSDLEGVARILGFSPGKTIELEEMWLSRSRKARQVVEHKFYGYEDE